MGRFGSSSAKSLFQQFSKTSFFRRALSSNVVLSGRHCTGGALENRIDIRFGLGLDVTEKMAQVSFEAVKVMNLIPC